jgi:hypothetical protein
MDYDLTKINVLEILGNDFIVIFETIRKRPELFLPRYSIFDLQAFHFGYSFCKEKNNIPLAEGDIKFEKFLTWIREEKSDIKTNMSWANLLFAYSSDERSALDFLFKLYDQFTLDKKSD